ncbi:MAG: ester cyclase [Pseudomonadota bacterium]
MTDIRAEARATLTSLLAENKTDAPLALAEDVVWDVSHPTNRLAGANAVEERFFGALRPAFAHLKRRDLLFIGGRNTRPAGGNWVATVTHYTGVFRAPLFGLSPTLKLAFLRAGEFYRIEDGMIVEAKIILDLPDLMLQSGRLPLPHLLGTELAFPAPATQDGLCPVGGDGTASLDIVETMLSDLHAYDPETAASVNQTGPDGYWTDDFLWYGPAGIGSTVGWDGFVSDHRAAFLRAFPDRKGGNHYCRFGDGDYAAVSGWPSMTMTHKGNYLGIPATDRNLTLRVMDFYRCDFDTDRGRIAENWVLLDYVDLFNQMGVNLIARSEAMRS